MTLTPLTERDAYQLVIKSGLRIAIFTCALAAAATGVADAATIGNVPPETGMRAIERTYHQLVDELDQSRNARPDRTMRLRITRAAQEFQTAIKRDGGARSNLSTDAKNIIISLGDGTFNADASIDVLRRDAKGNLVDVATRKPS